MKTKKLEKGCCLGKRTLATIVARVRMKRGQVRSLKFSKTSSICLSVISTLLCCGIFDTRIGKLGAFDAFTIFVLEAETLYFDVAAHY